MVYQTLASSSEELRYFAGGIFTCCLASTANDKEWLEETLGRILSPACLDVRTSAGLLAQGKDLVGNGGAEEMVETFAQGAHFGVGDGSMFLKAIVEEEVRHSPVGYDSRLREALLRFSGVCKLCRRVLMEAEGSTGRELIEEMMREEKSVKKKGGDDGRKRKRWMMIGGAGLVGGVALGLSGGLLAPVIVPAVSTTAGIAGIGGGMALSATGSAAVVGTVFGAAGAGIGGSAMANRTGDLTEFEFERCAFFGDGTIAESGVAKITPRESICEVPVKVAQGSEGGLIAWEYSAETEKKKASEFAIGIYKKIEPMEEPREVRDSGSVPKDWLVEEEIVHTPDANARKTGAMTVMEGGVYVLRWRLVGQTNIDIRYRIAHIPPGNDVPSWLMASSEDKLDACSEQPKSLAVTIFVPGFLPVGIDPKTPGIFSDQFSGSAKALNKYGGDESFALRWESKKLAELTNAMMKMIKDLAVSTVSQVGLKLALPALGTLMGALALPAGIASALKTLIDNQWAVVTSRAREAGRMLAAEVLSTYRLGRRPVSLVGYSAGGLAVFACLEELYAKKQFGLIHEAYILGAPAPVDVRRWKQIRKIVSGRLVNGYMRDWYLELFHRAGGGTGLAVAGLRPVGENEVGVRNIDMQKLGVSSHEDYMTHADEVLLKLGLGDGEKQVSWPNAAGRNDDEVHPSSPDSTGALTNSAGCSDVEGNKTTKVQSVDAEGDVSDSSVEVFANQMRLPKQEQDQEPSEQKQ